MWPGVRGVPPGADLLGRDAQAARCGKPPWPPGRRCCSLTSRRRARARSAGGGGRHRGTGRRRHYRAADYAIPAGGGPGRPPSPRPPATAPRFLHRGTACIRGSPTTGNAKPRRCRITAVTYCSAKPYQTRRSAELIAAAAVMGRPWPEGCTPGRASIPAHGPALHRQPDQGGFRQAHATASPDGGVIDHQGGST
jgi:hypothetical protein